MRYVIEEIYLHKDGEFITVYYSNKLWVNLIYIRDN